MRALRRTTIVVACFTGSIASSSCENTTIPPNEPTFRSYTSSDTGGDTGGDTAPYMGPDGPKMDLEGTLHPCIQDSDCPDCWQCVFPGGYCDWSCSPGEMCCELDMTVCNPEEVGCSTEATEPTCMPWEECEYCDGNIFYTQGGTNSFDCCTFDQTCVDERENDSERPEDHLTSYGIGCAASCETEPTDTGTNTNTSSGSSDC